MPDGARLEVGRIGRPHGLKGEVTVMLVTDRHERLDDGAQLFADERTLTVEHARPQRDGWVVRFQGVTTREGAEALRGLILTADPIDAGDDPWVHDLIGCEVSDVSGRALGSVTAVEANPAHDLLVLEGGALVPMPFVVEHEPGRVVIDPPEGLL
ncbi:MAG: 16S rRNA processing protein RimM [Actinobacteria bacterium]|nr:16S rRNA processing protein RimM [Actinomycetota bacterium]